MAGGGNSPLHLWIDLLSRALHNVQDPILWYPLAKPAAIGHNPAATLVWTLVWALLPSMQNSAEIYVPFFSPSCALISCTLICHSRARRLPSPAKPVQSIPAPPRFHLYTSWAPIYACPIDLSTLLSYTQLPLGLLSLLTC